ncbi:unnamed protein product [Rotaria sordida]|uniref:EF-hand domain-containing protein n=1 Tax=Rotaria sordida TaxID=392033 RepID=A0A819FDF0_9BILA|nr:unnamed protein product [Rotaria sordida]CAF1116713.1 unnamed protein product [Rotaria sordida]CAF1146144.1 unnamed protein product [Rotaria sordida]CAF1155603.1 unnamed protein product [Rotaria sordida]CAF1397458.1 unnamed protein product [Rotaria sordida]
MFNEHKIIVTETISEKYGQIAEVQYEYDENDYGKNKKYHIKWSRQDYNRTASRLYRPSMSYDKFIKVLRTFMMGKYAIEDVPEAFRLLDTDRSNTIDITKLHEFICIILPKTNPYLLLHQIQKADRDGDYKLNFNEFKSFIEQGCGRNVSIGCL